MSRAHTFSKRKIILSVFCCLWLAVFGLVFAGCNESSTTNSTWLSGTDAPTNELGTNGDMYIDTDDNILYQKLGGIWTVVVNNFGGGASGDSANKWMTGTSAPHQNLGIDGDMYLDTVSSTLYQKISGAWTIVMENFGKGESAPAKQWIVGTETPSTTIGNDGDMYIDTDDYILYQKLNGEWAIVMEDFGKGESSPANKWMTGTATPTDDMGIDGDMYLDTDDYILYQKTAGAWVVAMEDFGKGESAPASEWLVGTETPDASVGKDGDMYIDTDDYILYQKENGIWNTLITDFGKGFDESELQTKLDELEQKINSGKIDIDRLSSYQNEVIYDKTNLITADFSWLDNSYVGYTTGKISSNNSIYIATETYVPVEEGKNYVLFMNQQAVSITHYAFYNEGFGYISGSNGARTMVLAPEDAAYIRFTVQKVGIVVDFDTFISSELEFYNQNSTAYSAPQSIAVIQGINANDTLIDNSISVEKCEFFDKYDSPNLIQPGKVFDGCYMGTTSTIVAENSVYTVMTEIPVVEGQILNVWQGSFSKVSMRFVTQFDENFRLISLTATDNENANITDFTVPLGTKYVAITIYSSAWNGTEKIQVQCSIDGLYLGKYYEPGVPIYKLNGNYYDMVAEQAPLHVYLPDEICVAEGRTIELYNSQICLEYEDYNFQWLASGFGRPYERKFSITGTENLTGQTKTLTLNLFDDNLNIKYTASCTVRFVSKVIDTEQLIIPIGDSLTNNKAWLTKVNEYSDGKIKFRGTQGTMDKTDSTTMSHEGRSGATTGWYNLGTSKYTFNPTNTTLEVKEDTDGTQYTENPFWNPTTDAFDFDYYCNKKAEGGAGYFQDENAQEISITPTGVQIYLGTNGISLDSTSSVNNIKTLIDNIRKSSKGATIPIYVVNTLFRPNQIFATNSDGYATNDSGEFSFRANMKVMNLEIGLYEALQDYDNVFFVPVAATHDSEYNYPYEEVPVNPHSEETFKQYTDCVHPTTAGYYQMADIMFSTIAAHYKD